MLQTELSRHLPVSLLLPKDPGNGKEERKYKEEENISAENSGWLLLMSSSIIPTLETCSKN